VFRKIKVHKIDTKNAEVLTFPVAVSVAGPFFALFVLFRFQVLGHLLFQQFVKHSF